MSNATFTCTECGMHGLPIENMAHDRHGVCELCAEAGCQHSPKCAMPPIMSNDPYPPCHTEAQVSQ